MDDRRVGLVIRALRRRRGMRQTDLAQAARVSQSVISRAERGHLTTLSTATVRSILTALDARAEWDVRWRGGQLDRLVDSRHAALVGLLVTTVRALGWHVMQEVTFARYGERGSIDALAINEAERAVLISEVKSEITSWEETQRKFDMKVRLLPSILHERLGWRPRLIAQVLVVEESMTNRRRIAQVATAAADMYPCGGREVRRWLRQPTGNLAGLWFLSVIPRRTVSERRGGSHRVRQPPGRPEPLG